MEDAWRALELDGVGEVGSGGRLRRPAIEGASVSSRVKTID